MTAKDLKTEATKHGATVEDQSAGDWSRYLCCCPEGKVWAATGDVHMLVVEWKKQDAKWREASIKDALERMALGVSDCDNPECDYCCPEV